jgi:hypothetical protein
MNMCAVTTVAMVMMLRDFGVLFMTLCVYCFRRIIFECVCGCYLNGNSL